MSDTKSESISSLIDNFSPSSDESVSDHLVDNMLKDEHLSRTWQNYHLIGDVLRDELPQSLQLDLSAKISTAIAQEATILSPNSATQKPTATDETLVSTSATDVLASQESNVVNASNRFKAVVSRLVKPLGQVAIAASAAGLMIVGVQSNVADNALPITPTQVVQTTPLAGYANPVSFSVQEIQQSNHRQGKQASQQVMNQKIIEDRVAQQRRLQALLKDHQQQVQLGSKIK
ncbi:sigma-E factor negative regulatory protein [Colwelliaceae bacterium MEBiC 14330]